jgi:hypothetical protein
VCAVSAYRCRRSSKYWLRIIEAIGWLYFASLYLAAYLGFSSPAFLAGIYTRAGVLVMAALFVAEIIADWTPKDEC